MPSIRETLTPSQRATTLDHTIDPGFVHHRKIETILGQPGMRVINELIAQLPEMPPHLREVRIDHIYTRVFLSWCNSKGIKPLGDSLVNQSGIIVCSTEMLAPCPNFSEGERAISTWVPNGEIHQTVEFHYSTQFVRSATLRGKLLQGFKISIVAELSYVCDELIVFEPIIMGFPWLERGESNPNFEIMLYGPDFFEHFVEDFDEFSKVRQIPNPPSPEPMRMISESAFKTCLAKILGDTAPQDWGGEESDYYSAHLHLTGRRVTGTFLLKGPAKFAPMGLNHLGKNNDQINRLAHQPAEVLIVQHCHDILPVIRDTLRVFAVQPSRPRRYCLIDGRDSLRLLQAYELYEEALELSRGR